MDKRLLIEPLMDETEAAVQVTREELATALTFASPRRKREFLTWRTLIRRELGAVRIGYNLTGAPVLTDRSDLHIGVSHCPGWVAVCISDAPCAVDIELKTRDFQKVAPRFMTANECSLSNDPLWPGIVWCAKETLYKYAGQPGLDLLHDLRIEAFDPAEGHATGRIKNGTPVRLSVRCDADLIVASIF